METWYQHSAWLRKMFFSAYPFIKGPISTLLTGVLLKRRRKFANFTPRCSGTSISHIARNRTRFHLWCAATNIPVLVILCKKRPSEMRFDKVFCLVEPPPFTLPHFHNFISFSANVVSPHFIHFLSSIATLYFFVAQRWTRFSTGTVGQ